ncbi:MAG: radical SAM family heme chaperone HemW [Pseudomonadales bacterium]
MSDIPVGLYIHVPWCIKKCPYCDFNSHKSPELLPEKEYLKALERDALVEAQGFKSRPVSSIFIGGGTPSLLSGEAVEQLLLMVNRNFSLESDCEITLEANPGAVERERFKVYRSAGVNRISLGAQSFDDKALKQLGRVHGSSDIERAIDAIANANIPRWNIDLMHGLPGQTVESAMQDLRRALTFAPKHLSWYQLTIETNTAFYSEPPTLPDEDCLADIQDEGHALLLSEGLNQYEVSAYASDKERSRHNLNYWQFGDYAALGAGAHGKLSQTSGQGLDVSRHWRIRQPDSFIAAVDSIAGRRTIDNDDLVFEFMLNAMRLMEGFQPQLFVDRTGLSMTSIESILTRLISRELIEETEGFVRATELGRRYLNDLINEFIPA